MINQGVITLHKPDNRVHFVVDRGIHQLLSTDSIHIEFLLHTHSAKDPPEPLPERTLLAGAVHPA